MSMDVPGSFSILERIVVGETTFRAWIAQAWFAFSILERIVVGETFMGVVPGYIWLGFQYPRTDRCG